MEIFRNFFMAYDIQEGGYPNTANEHNDHNDNFTGIAEVRCNSHRKADWTESRTYFKNDLHQSEIFGNG